MVTAERKPVLVVIAAAVCLALTARSGPAEEDVDRGTMTECFFHQVEDGSVWLSQPLVALGMIGVPADPPKYRLNDDLARQLAPVVNKFSNAESREFYWLHQVPRGRDPNDPTILVTVIIQYHKVAGEADKNEKATSKPMGRRGSIRQIDAAEILQVEIVPRSWLDAWDTLDKALKETVDISMNAPGTDKRARLTDVIQRGGEPLGFMLKAAPTDKQVQYVRGAVPKARVVKTFQRHVEREWGGRLRQFASTLAIQPPKPLPPDTEKCSYKDLRKLLLESDSPAAFIAKVKQSCSSEALDDLLTFSMLRGTVKGGSYTSQPIYVWQVERMTVSDLELLKDELKRYSDMPHPVNVPTPEQQAQEATATLKDKWGIVVRPADSSELADKLLLSGMVVDEVVQSGSPIGLQRGDVILDYNTVYDLVMGAPDPSLRVITFARKTHYPGDLRVLRAGQALTIPIGKSK